MPAIMTGLNISQADCHAAVKAKYGFRRLGNGRKLVEMPFVYFVFFHLIFKGIRTGGSGG